MFSTVCFIVAMLAEGLRGIATRKRPLYLTFSIYAVAFVLYLVTQ